ncbi:PAS domain S-box protein [Thiocapsa rosea]|uniref:histidine kinase n=1 Tax=Thiocapsa rosea TaxID=69360 RepID=A0A495VE73_9GAMM|nr:PAS domain S-box protein [Thiocapsa rosea]RKT46128.1 PAS domain S-box-containing protein [Thiocapsa rosea]
MNQQSSPGATMSPIRTVALTVLLTLLAVVGNHFNLSLFFGLQIIFGSVAVLLAIVWFGTRAGLIVAAASGAYTYFLWDHPFALLIFLAEAAFVGWHRDHARRRGRATPDLGVSVMLYWVLIGIPLVLLFYRGVMEMVWHQTLVVAVKQALNGILNAALAGLVVMVVAAMRRRSGSLSARQVLFTLFLSGFLLPSILVVAWENYDLKDRLEQDLADRLRTFGVLTIHELDTGPRGTSPEAAEIHLDHVREMARLFGNTLPEYAKLEVRLIGPAGDPGPPAGAPNARTARTAADDLMILAPEDWHPSRMAFWWQSRYRMILPLAEPTVGEGLLIELSAATLVDKLQHTVLRLLTLLLAIAAIAILLADRFALLLVRPLNQLVGIAADLPARIVAGETPAIPSPGLLAEGRALTDAFGVMSRGLSESFAMIERERDAQSRLRSVRDLQAKMLAGLMTSGEDERTAAERLCALVEGIAPGCRCVLFKKGLADSRVHFAGGGLGAGEYAELERRVRERDPAGVSRMDSASRFFVVESARDATDRRQTDILSAGGEAFWWCSDIITQDNQCAGVLAIGPCPSREPDADVPEILEAAADLAALAFETLRTRQRHAVLIKALSQAGTGIVVAGRVAGADYRISYVNQGFETLTGYRADEVMGLNCRFLQGDDRGQPERARIRAALASGEPCQVTLRNYRKDGTAFWNALNVAPLVDSRGEVTHYVGIQQDITAVKEAMERLARSEAMLREAQATAHLGTWDLDYDSGRIEWSDEAFRLLGYAPGAVTPSLDAFCAAVPEEDAARVRAEMESVITRPDGRFVVEHRVQGANGVQRILRAEGRVHFADNGTPLRLSGTALDITAQRAIEEALRSQEERYRLVVENIEDLVVRMDAEGRFEYVSPSYCRLFGRDEAGLIGHHFLPNVHPADRDATTAAMNALRHPPYTCLFDQRARTVKGWRWLQWVDRALVDGEGRIHSIIGIGRDITERKTAELALTQERRRLADIIDGTQVGTWEWDLVTNDLTLNPRWAEMLGRRLEDLEPTTIETWQMFCHPEDLSRSESEVARHLCGETDHYRCELRMLHDDGSWIWIQDQGRVSARDAQGRPLRMAGIHEDITVRREAEIELMRRESLERELLGLASDFVAVYDENLDPLINRTLERLGGFTESDRAYVFRFDLVADTMSNSHEWVAQGVEPMIGHLQCLPIDHFSASMHLLKSGQAAVVPRVAELPDAWAKEREILQFQSILSVVLVPLLQNERLIGFVGFDAVQVPRDWSEAEVRFLRVFSSILVSAFERARTYAELRESNLRYDQLALHSRTVNWEVDADGLFIYLSPTVETVWGYRCEDLIGRKHFFDLAPEASRDSLKAETLHSFARLDHFTDYVNPIRCADGSTIWVLSSGAPVVAEDGTLLGYRGTDVDITERHRVQEQLEKSEARLSAIFENAPLGISIVGPNRRLHLVNRALGEFLGYSSQDLVGTGIDEITFPDDLATELVLFGELMAGKRNFYRMTMRYRKADGSLAWGDLRVAVLPGGSSERPLTLAMVEDITEFQAATERKRELEGTLLRYTNSLESLVDLASQALPAAEELLALLQLGCVGLGMDAGEISEIRTDQTPHPIVRFPPADAPGSASEASIPEDTAGQETIDAEPGVPHVLFGAALPAATANAGYLVCVRMALSWIGPNGRANDLVIRFLGHAERSELSGPERELVRLLGQRIVAQQYQRQLQAALISAKERETIGHLASGVAHDFNNLLGVIDANLYYLEAILSGEQGDPEVAQVIEETQSALGQAKVVTSGMLSLSRAGGIVLERVALEKTIRELVTIIRQVLPAKINLGLDLEPGLAAESNASFLQAALLNLVLNARDAMPDGGDLLIAVQTVVWDASVPLAVGRLDPGEYVQVRVVDTGCGMSEEVLDRLFEPLFSTKAKQRGHGLGLFMVQEFVVRSGAALAVSSQVGKGTEFRLLMPIDHQESPQIDRIAPSNALSITPLLRVLVVDDDPRVADSVGRLLMLDGALVSFAENGQDALDLLRHDADFDLVLSDLAMPVLDGAALCAELTQGFPDLKVILMTGQTPSAFSLDALPYAPLVLRKPIDHGALRAAIAEASARVGS